MVVDVPRSASKLRVPTGQLLKTGMVSSAEKNFIVKRWKLRRRVVLWKCLLTILDHRFEQYKPFMTYFCYFFCCTWPTLCTVEASEGVLAIPCYWEWAAAKGLSQSITAWVSTYRLSISDLPILVSRFTCTWTLVRLSLAISELPMKLDLFSSVLECFSLAFAKG